MQITFLCHHTRELLTSKNSPVFRLTLCIHTDITTHHILMKTAATTGLCKTKYKKYQLIWLTVPRCM